MITIYQSGNVEDRTKRNIAIAGGVGAVAGIGILGYGLMTARAERGYELTVGYVPTRGTVSISPMKDRYDEDEHEEVTLTATSKTGFKFDGWRGDYPEGEKDSHEITILMDEDKTINAYFISDVDDENDHDQPTCAVVECDNPATDTGLCIIHSKDADTPTPTNELVYLFNFLRLDELLG